MSDTPVHPLLHRALVRVDGAEAGDFLQDLVTADVSGVAEGAVRPAALLTPQGRVLFDLVVAREGDAFLLECDLARRDELIRKLKLYRMRRQVGIEADDRMVAATEGEAGGGHLDPRFGAGVRRLHLAAAPTSKADADAWRRLRWMDGIAEGADEIPPEKALPLEIRLELDGGIDFGKGCYIGQEVTARTRHRGLVKRSYVPVRIDRRTDAPAQIVAEGRDAGTLLSAFGDGDGMLGLASVRLEFLHAGTPSLSAGGAAMAPFVPERLRPLPGGS